MVLESEVFAGIKQSDSGWVEAVMEPHSSAWQAVSLQGGLNTMKHPVQKGFVFTH